MLCYSGAERVLFLSCDSHPAQKSAGKNSNTKSSVQNKKIINTEGLNFMRVSIPKCVHCNSCVHMLRGNSACGSVTGRYQISSLL